MTLALSPEMYLQLEVAVPPASELPGCSSNCPDDQPSQHRQTVHLHPVYVWSLRLLSSYDMLLSAIRRQRYQPFLVVPPVPIEGIETKYIQPVLSHIASPSIITSWNRRTCTKLCLPTPRRVLQGGPGEELVT
ncbi:hypothetical protein AcV5_006691 [Taiwanofungus camphoratus]|nr:hypothetical protein AcV5_006691 [Antrodia cinnamomea]